MDRKSDELTAEERGADQNVSASEGAGSQLAVAIAKYLVSAAILAASVGTFLWLGQPDSPARKKPPKPAGVAVKTVPVKLHQGPVTITTNGVVVPFREISIATEVSGRVVEQSANLRAGRRVSKGEVLIRIDPTEYQIQVRRLETVKQQAKAELDALDVTVANTQQLLELAKEELALQQAELKRIERLKERSASSTTEIEDAKRDELVSRTALVRIENELRNAAADRTLLQERLKLSGVELERARLDEERTVITSPVDGRIAQSLVEEQAYVTAGQPFARIEDAAAMEIRANLTMDEMHWLWSHRSVAVADNAPDSPVVQPRLGQRSMADEILDGNDGGAPISATVRCQIGGRQHQWNAVFRRVDGSGIDQNTRTVPCMFRVAAPNSTRQRGGRPEKSSEAARSHNLMRGMFVSVEIATNADQDLYRLPRESIRPGKRVWLNDNGRLRVAAVKVVSRFDQMTVVESAELDEGQQVITSPVPGAREGLVLMAAGGPPGGRPGAGNRVGAGNRPGAGQRPAAGQRAGGRPGGNARPGPAGDRRPPGKPPAKRKPEGDRLPEQSEARS